jgi:hypothetical protein
MVREDYAKSHLNRFSQHLLQDISGHEWEIQPAFGKHEFMQRGIDRSAPPMARGRLEQYVRLMETVGVSVILAHSQSIEFCLQTPSVLNRITTKSLYLGDLTDVQSLLPLDADWPNPGVLRRDRGHVCGYKRLVEAWSIELCYPDAPI